MSSPLKSEPARIFTTTRWSMVLRARHSNPEQTRAALEELCRTYWYPVYAFVRRKGQGPESAADLTQDFFLKLLEADFTKTISPQGGKFRSYLLTALNRFLINEWQRGQRQKRGGGAFINSLDAAIAEKGDASCLAELAHAETPEKLFQRAWAETLLAKVLATLKEECASRGDERFEILQRFLSLGEDPPGLAEAGANLGLTVPAFKSVLHRFRQRYRELLLAEVGQTVGNPAEVAEELRGLMVALRE